MSRKRRKKPKQSYHGPSDEEIKSVIREWEPACILGTEKEASTLSLTIAPLGDAIAHRAIDEWADVWTAIHTLTDATAVDELVKRVSPVSIFHENPASAARLATLLRYWKTLGFYTNDHSVVDVFNILYERFDADQQVLSWYAAKTA